MLKKLTDAQLSQILSAAEAGEIDFNDVTRCYAGTAFNGRPATLFDTADKPERWWEVSDAVQRAPKNTRRSGKGPYSYRILRPWAAKPVSSTEALRALRNAGLV